MKKSTRILTTAGVAAGAAIGILLAPAKGTDTRKKLNKQLKRLKALSWNEFGKQKLLAAKIKLEHQKEKIELHLKRIDTIIDEMDVNKNVKESV